METLKIAYVTIRFPEPSETFATNEVRVLAGEGASISVHGLRREHPSAARLRQEVRLPPDVVTTHNGIGASLRGLASALRLPLLLVETVAWIVRANVRRSSRDVWLSFLLLPRAFDVLAHIERERPDVVHMYWGHYPTIVGFLVQRRLPEIVTSVSIVAYDLLREYGGAITAIQNADVVRTHAQVNEDHVARFSGVPQDRISVIYNGVDVQWLESIRDAHEMVPLRIVSVARLVEKKGTDDVLKTFAALRSRVPGASLVIAGDGPDRARLETMCQDLGLSDAVHFLGQVPHARVVEEMAKAHVLLLLSRCEDERLPNVVKEGMVCGCVCVTTPTPGIAELVESGVSGFVVPMSDPAAACEVIDHVFSDDFHLASMQRRALHHITSSFDLTKTAPTYMALWSDAIERRRERSPTLPARAVS